MTYIVTSQFLGAQPIISTSTTKYHPVGTLVRAFDPTYGEGEFVYLPGVASTAIGSVVRYDESGAGSGTATTTLASSGGRGPVAVAMAANVAGQYGWYQVKGSAVVSAGTVAAGSPLYATATGGQAATTVVSGDKIDGAVAKAATGTPSAGFAVVEIERPVMNGNG